MSTFHRTTLLLATSLVGMTSAHAAEVVIEGTVTAVDAENLTVELEVDGEDQKLDVSRKAKVTIDGDESKLSAIKAGQAARLSYHDELEIVLRIDVLAKGLDGPPSDAVPFQGHVYKFFPNITSWRRANDHCKAMGGHLVTIGSAAENTFVLGVAQQGLARLNRNGKMDGVWLGATDEEAEGDWKWVDGSEFSLNNWLPNQPNNAGGDEHYLWMWVQRNGQWTDQANTPKEATTYYVCEWDELSDSGHQTLERTPLDEVNFVGANDVNPTLTSDGLHLFWQAQDTTTMDQWIYSASRTTPQSRFTGRAKLFRGFNPVITADGLSLFFYDSVAEGVAVATRRKQTEPFLRPRAVPELHFKGYPSGVSSDGRTLYLDIHSPHNTKHSPAHVVSRSMVGARWGEPVPLNVELDTKTAGSTKFLAASPVDEEQLAVGAMMVVENGDSQRVRGVVLIRDSDKASFTRLAEIQMTPHQNQKAGFFAPRYVWTTGELFVQSADFFPNREIAEKQRVDLWVVTGYQPPSR